MSAKAPVLRRSKPSNTARPCGGSDALGIELDQGAAERGGRAIAYFKTWLCMHTDYRRPKRTYATAFSTIRALHFFDHVCIRLMDRPMGKDHP
jgi:hypothetical protein